MGKGTGGVMDAVLGRRYTRNPESPPLWIDIPIFFFLPWTELVKFLLNFSYFFLLPFLFSKFCSKNGISFLHVYSFPVAFFLASMGLSLNGGHFHDPHRCWS